MKGAISKLTQEELQKIIDEAQSVSQVLEKLGLRAAGGNFKSLKERCIELEIDLDNIRQRSNLLKTQTLKRSAKMDLNHALIPNSLVSRSHLKKRLIKDGLLQNQCYSCKLFPEWNGSLLVLQLDHINGIWNDNRIENLRLLCPNCHSQTKTFAGRGNNQSKKIKVKKSRPTKIDWPQHTELQKLVHQFGYCEIGRRLGVSDNAIRKHLMGNSLIGKTPDFESGD